VVSEYPIKCLIFILGLSFLPPQIPVINNVKLICADEFVGMVNLQILEM